MNEKGKQRNKYSEKYTDGKRGKDEEVIIEREKKRERETKSGHLKNIYLKKQVIACACTFVSCSILDR